MIGNQRTTRLLERIAASNSIGHAYLFCGPEGVGKKIAAIEFARLINCNCDGNSRCESCQAIDTLNNPELLILEDANEPRWFERESIINSLSKFGIKDDEEYKETVASIIEKGFLEEPYPAIEKTLAIDGFRIVTNLIFGRGAVPSSECYTPVQLSETLRRQHERGDITSAEHFLLRLLYEYPISVTPYRGSIPIAYVTPRQNWKLVRPLQKFLAMRSISEGRKVVIIDDAHKMTPEAQNCLLKTLEEPPADSVVILVTAHKELLFETIVSRCQIIDFFRLTAEQMREFLNVIGGSGDDVRFMISLSEGSPRKLLDLVTGDIGERLDAVASVIESMTQGKPIRIFEFTRSIISRAGTHRKRQQKEVGQALELLVFYLVQILHIKKGRDIESLSPRLLERLSKQADLVDEAKIHEAIELISDRYEFTRRNIDMPTLLQSTMLRVSLLLSESLFVDSNSA